MYSMVYSTVFIDKFNLYINMFLPLSYTLTVYIVSPSLPPSRPSPCCLCMMLGLHGGGGVQTLFLTLPQLADLLKDCGLDKVSLQHLTY